MEGNGYNEVANYSQQQHESHELLCGAKTQQTSTVGYYGSHLQYAFRSDLAPATAHYIVCNVFSILSALLL